MYKISSQISNPNMIMIRKKLADGTFSALVLTKSTSRQFSTQDPMTCPPPKPPKKSHKLLWGSIGAIVFTGSAVVYAKSSPEARNWLASNIPAANDFIALVYEENTTYGKFAATQFNKYTTFLSHFLFGKEGVTPEKITPRSEQDLEKDAAIGFGKKEYELPPPTLEPLYVGEVKIETPEIETPAIVVQTEECVPATPEPVNVTKDLVELEQDMHENTKLAMDNYKTALAACAAYNTALFKIVEYSIEDLDKRYFSKLVAARSERDKAIKLAKEAKLKARCALEMIDRRIDAGAVQVPAEFKAQTQRYIKQFRSDLEGAEEKYKAELEKSVLSDKYWNKVEAARNAYKEELQYLFPGVDLCARKLDSKGDLDLLLLYTLKQVQYLQKELAELQTVRDLKLSRAIECHDEKALIEAKAEDTAKRMQLEKNREFARKSLEVQAEANRNLREQLKRQFEIQQEILTDKVLQKEKEVLSTFDRVVSEQIQAERVEFKKQLAAMAAKMSAIEQTLKQRAGAEEEARRSQSLWAAAEALLAAIRRTDEVIQVDHELKALEKAGKNDKMVETVLKGVPEDVRKTGVATEKTLRLRFDELERTATKVALVGRDGATLPIYFLSWLQSKLMFTKFAEIPKEELNNQPIDFTELDTFEIIQRARYHMDHGDISSALRYVNLLQGAPRAAAKCWLQAARRHLEVRQVAEAVMAHASVSGLLYL